MCHFVISDTIKLRNVILPIFDKYPLLTTKRFNYLKFKKALYIHFRDDLSMSKKIQLIDEIKVTTPSPEYLSDAWNSLLNKIKMENFPMDPYNTYK